MMRTALALGLGCLTALAACAQTAEDSPEATERRTDLDDARGGADAAGHRGRSHDHRDLSASTTTDLQAKRYVAAGDRSYVIGAADGSFAPMGWHIRGEMGGVWVHPIKLLDGYWFALDGAWLPSAERYTTGLGWADGSQAPSSANQ